MNENNLPAKGLLTVERGGAWQASRIGCKRTRINVPIQLERPLDNAMRTAFTKWRGADGATPSRGVQKIREGLAKPWKHIARYFIEARVCQVSYADAMAVIRALEWWVNALYGKTTASSPTMELIQGAHSSELTPNDGKAA